MSKDGGRSSEDEHSGESGALAAAREHVHARDRDVPSETDHVSGPSREARPLPLNSRKISHNAETDRGCAGSADPRWVGGPSPAHRGGSRWSGSRTHAGSGDLRLLKEAAVGGAGHEPQNVQVLLQETDGSTAVCLQDADGVFLTAPPHFPRRGNDRASQHWTGPGRRVRGAAQPPTEARGSHPNRGGGTGTSQPARGTAGASGSVSEGAVATQLHPASRV